MLGGVTRMTLTLATILVEVSHDVEALLPMMLVLVCAKISGDLMSPSFDDAMIMLQQLPYLEEKPPREFDVLTARDVMSNEVVVLRETELVGHLVALLKRTTHNGFPVVDPTRGDDGLNCTFMGLILRRQLLVLLHERVWELQAEGKWINKQSRDLFVDCRGQWMKQESQKRYVDELTHTMDVIASLNLTDADKAAAIDLRPFMDPSPYVVNELMTLRRVYRLFNEIGVRHLTVVDCREQVVGIITRNDILPEIIEHRVMAEPGLAEVKQFLHRENENIITSFFRPSAATSSAAAGAERDSARNPRSSQDARERQVREFHEQNRSKTRRHIPQRWRSPSSGTGSPFGVRLSRQNSHGSPLGVKLSRQNSPKRMLARSATANDVLGRSAKESSTPKQ